MRQSTQLRRWVPKLARRYVKPEDICFSDVTQYDPRLLEQAPYRLPITSTVPLLADKVKPYVHACNSPWHVELPVNDCSLHHM